jgi:uracil-DNA glycosylase family 4
MILQRARWVGPMTKLEMRRYYLQAMGIQLWERRSEASCAEEKDSEMGHTEEKELDWEQLEAQVSGCTACALHTTRIQTVFGVGNRNAGWMIIGEAPGAEEDRRGEPFVGRAGQLLDAMLRAIELNRQEVYIANVLKCRPPKNRDPKPEEVACCEPFLQRQVALIQPRIILAVGRIAAQNLLKTTLPLGRMRGRVYEYGQGKIPVVVTYHPAFLLRSPKEKRKAWEDLCFARRTYQAQRDPQE